MLSMQGLTLLVSVALFATCLAPAILLGLLVDDWRRGSLW